MAPGGGGEAFAATPLLQQNGGLAAVGKSAPASAALPPLPQLPPSVRHELLSPDADLGKVRAERQARREVLKAVRQPVSTLPVDELFELPGRPNVVYALRDYSKPDVTTGRQAARAEVPFLFKAFESGQAPPPRPGTKKAEQPRAATIHEYLDWTVTASQAEDPDELDFGGFRVVVLMPRFRLQWPPPNCPDTREVPRKHTMIGAPKPAIPLLQVHQKPICAATIRLGPGWMEVPFYATQELRRNKGYGRAMLEAIEDMCRALNVPRILLCSTDDPRTKSTWERLGFSFTQPGELEAWGVTQHDLLHMDNTVQMHKEVSPPRTWRSLILRHEHLMQRLYYLPGAGASPAKPAGMPLLNGNGGTAACIVRKPSKQPTKKRRR